MSIGIITSIKSIKEIIWPNFLTYQKYYDLCRSKVTAPILKLGQQLETQCEIKARDALHVASAIIGKARYFLVIKRSHKLNKLNATVV